MEIIRIFWPMMCSVSFNNGSKVGVFRRKKKGNVEAFMNNYIVDNEIGKPVKCNSGTYVDKG
jgi:hypothetical protein